MAHIGVIKALAELGIPIDHVGGSRSRHRRRSGHDGLDVGRDAPYDERVEEPVVALRPDRAHGVGVIGPARPAPSRGHVGIARHRGLPLRSFAPTVNLSFGWPSTARDRRSAGTAARQRAVCGRCRGRDRQCTSKAAGWGRARRDAPWRARPDRRRRRVRRAERDDGADRSGAAVGIRHLLRRRFRHRPEPRRHAQPVRLLASLQHRSEPSSKPTSTSHRIWPRSASAARPDPRGGRHRLPDGDGVAGHWSPGASQGRPPPSMPVTGVRPGSRYRSSLRLPAATASPRSPPAR